MSMKRWNPFADPMELRSEMDRFFRERFPGIQGGVPAVDVYETDDTVEVEAELPGFKREDVEITLTGTSLRIEGEREEEREVDEGRYHRKESARGRTSRVVTLPTAVQSEGAEARFEDGVLKISLPKAAESSTRKIRIEP